MSETPYKDKCVVMIRELIEQSLEDHYCRGHADRCKNVLAMDAFANLRDHPHAPKINAFVGNVMQEISKEKYAKHKDIVLALILEEVKGLVFDFLSEEEAKDLHTFGTSPTGRKVFRNLDLLRSAIQKGRNVLIAEIITAWSTPEVAEKINDYIESISE